MKLRRRGFLKAGAATTALLTACKSRGKQPEGAETPQEAAEAPGKWVATTCQGCTTWCPVEVYVQDGRAVKVRGNPRSKQNDGTCCPRAHLALQQLYDPDRVKVPMKRTNRKKGRGEHPGFVAISWKEALETIADKILELRAAGEPEKYMRMRCRYTYMRDVIYDAMTKIIGSPNNISHSAICAEAEKFGAYFTAGNWDYRDYDLIKTKYLLIWGCDPISSNRMVPASIQHFGKVLDQATVAVVDPKLQASAAKAHEWLPVKAGQDGALASAMAHVILTRGLWHKEVGGDLQGGGKFVAGQQVEEAAFEEVHTHGLVKWWNLELKDRTPEWAAAVTGVPADQIVRVATGLGENAPNVIVWLGPGACMHPRGGYSAMAIHALNGLLGAIDSEGGVLGKMSPPVLKMPKLDRYQDELAKKHSKMPKIDGRGTKEFPALKKGKSGGGVVTNNAADGIRNSDPYDIKLAIGYMNNFPFSAGGGQRWEEALSKLPFYVHITTHASEMTHFADIVLPAATNMFERWGFLKTKAQRYGAAVLMQPVVDPLWKVYTDETEIPYMIAAWLAHKGFPNLLDFYEKEYKDPETGAEPKSAAQFAEFATKYYTAPLWDGKNEIGGDTIAGWEAFKAAGVWNSDPYPYRKRWGKFKTKTKKFEFYSETLHDSLKKHADKHGASIDEILETCKYDARGELAFVPHYEPPLRWGDESEYPFVFIDYKSRLNREGRSANLTWYQEFKKVDPGDASWDDVLKINPLDAERLGIAAGDMVRISTVTGSWAVKAMPWEGVRPGEVTKCYGQGHWAYGSVASLDFDKREARGVNNNDLMPAEYDRLSGSTARNGGFVGVRIEKV